jgi:hypothetical protein
MDPQPLGPAQWTQINGALIDLVLFVTFGVDAAFALLLGYAVLPSLVAGGAGPSTLLGLRRALVPIGLVSAALMLISLGRGLALALGVLRQVYPRFAL